MFSAHLRHAFRTCDKLIIRTLRGQANKLLPKGPNPGLDSRLRAFKKEGLKITDDDAEEFVEQSESDFYKVGEAYNEHLNETLIGKYEVRHRIVQDKYFKENMPNLLTWSEKEQIRHLHNEHPEEWTPEKLAESFPVTVPVVKKLLKYPWKPASQERITRHDASAMRNWKELKEGSLNISEDIREHFLKFSNRTIPPIKKESIKIDLTQEKIGEYESIVKRCAAQAQARHNADESSNSDETINKTDHVKRDQKRVTLEELTTKIKKRIERGKTVDIPDQIILDTVNTKTTSVAQVNTAIDVFEPSESNQVVGYKEEENDDKNIMEYPEKITIPRSAYKKGATYKVNDCYYDHDGQFLYRVLGMSNN